MKKLLLLTAVCFMFCDAALAQRDIRKDISLSDSIDLITGFSGTRFYHHDTPLKMRQLRDVLRSNEQAYMHFNASKSPGAWATILSCAGGFLVGWPIGTAIAGGNPNWALAGVGAGLVAVSVPLNIVANRKLRKAVNAYNAAL
ncbi:MAG TPA: hypothetical protein PKV73_02130 [Agriterribacter sp.]|nr:hypothetical protein [Agriterribacter sp.]